jgi:hypothetical protein
MVSIIIWGPLVHQITIKVAIPAITLSGKLISRNALCSMDASLICTPGLRLKDFIMEMLLLVPTKAFKK